MSEEVGVKPLYPAPCTKRTYSIHLRISTKPNQYENQGNYPQYVTDRINELNDRFF